MRSIIISLIIIVIASASMLMAHPPSSLEITFDAAEKILTIEVKHSVGNADNHYINAVTITHGDNQLIVHNLSKQESREGVTLKYRLPDIELGEKLNVVAACNRVGRLSKEITLL